MKIPRGLMLIFTVCFLVVFQQSVVAQDSAMVKKEFKNIIHFNITNPIIFGSRSLIFGYERVVGKHQSFSVNIGAQDFPSLHIRDDDSIKAKSLNGQKGFNVSGDYRFYLAKENKYNAPRGIYIGPYFSYNYFDKQHSWDIINNSGANLTVETETSLKVATLGIELGYQFVFWDRISLDLAMIGPGMASYNLKTVVGTNLTDVQREKLFEKLNEALAEKFPAYDLVINNEEFKKKGTANTTTYGYRYMVQIGYRF